MVEINVIDSRPTHGREGERTKYFGRLMRNQKYRIAQLILQKGARRKKRFLTQRIQRAGEQEVVLPTFNIIANTQH